MKKLSLLDPTFRYTPAAETNIRKTFARIRREQRAAQLQSQQLITEISSEKPFTSHVKKFMIGS